MASEADSFLFARSATQDSTQSRTRGRSAHTTWIHSCMAHEEDRKDLKLKYCIHCTTTPIYGTIVTTNMQAHLQTKHAIIIERELSSIQATTL